MFPVYFNALIKEDGSLTKNSDGSYSLVFSNVKNSVVLYQSWDANSIMFNLRDYKVFSLDHALLIQSINKYNKIADNLIESLQQGYKFSPTVLIRIDNKPLFGKVTNYDLSTENQTTKITYNISFFDETIPSFESFSGLIEMNMSSIIYPMIKNANKDMKFLKWLDAEIENLGFFEQLSEKDIVFPNFNMYLENNVEISSMGGNNYKMLLKNNESFLVYQVWNKLTVIANEVKNRPLINPALSELYSMFKENQYETDRLLQNDASKYYFLPAASLRLVKDGVATPYLVQITDVVLETNNNEVSYALIVNTNKFEVYNYTEKLNLPLGTFDISMDIDAGAGFTSGYCPGSNTYVSDPNSDNKKNGGSGGGEMYKTRLEKVAEDMIDP